MTHGIDDAGVPPTVRPDRGVGLRFAVAFAISVSAVLLLSLFWADRSGVSARSLPEDRSLVVVDDSAQLLDAWERAGVRGAVLVDATRDLGFAMPDWRPPMSESGAGWPVMELDLQQRFRAAVGRPSVIWVANKTGLVRSVTYVLRPEALAEKVRVGRERGYPGIAADDGSILANDDGYLRLIDDQVPRPLPAGAVLNVDASYFANATAEDLMAALGDSASSYRFVTLNRARDATDVPEAARAEIDRLPGLLSGVVR